MIKEPTIQDVMNVLNEHSAYFTKIDQRLGGIDQRLGGIDQRFDGIDQRFDGIDQRFDGIDQKFGGIDQRFGGIDQRFDSISEQIQGLATHMDERFDEQGRHFDKKLSALRDDLILLARRANTKLSLLIEGLVAEKSLDPATARRILALEPFPQA